MRQNLRASLKYRMLQFATESSHIHTHPIHTHPIHSYGFIILLNIFRLHFPVKQPFKADNAISEL